MTKQLELRDGWLDRLSGYGAVAVLALVPFHAFLTIWFSTFVGHYTLLRLWDDGLLVVLLAITATWLVRDKDAFRRWRASLPVRLIAVYAVLTLLLGGVSLLKGDVDREALAYGLLVNLRFLAWFLVVCLVAQRSVFLRRHWRGLALVPAAVVVVFAVLQYTVLPHDILSHVGYNTATTISPIETINHNPHYIRVQSTLRGANPLGAYLVIVSAVLTVLLAQGYRRLWLAPLAALTAFALYASGSRSAWIGSLLAVAAAVWLSLGSPRQRRLVAYGAAGLAGLCVVAAILLHNQIGFENALLHTQRHSQVSTSSNAAHASALKAGLQDVVRQPLGDGPGTAGQASAYNAPHPARIAEDYYVQIAQEVGIAGVVLFVTIISFLARQLFYKRSSPLALIAFASLLGISFVCLLSHAWSDDTLAFSWWGLAGIALAADPSREKTETAA